MTQPSMFAEKHMSTEQVQTQIQAWKENGESVVLAFGCFDLLHVGCVRFLQHAAEQGNKLIVGVCDDKGVSSLRGPSLPVLPLEHRLILAAAVQGVDVVTAISLDQSHDTINSIQPDLVLVGQEYPELCSHTENCKVVPCEGSSKTCSDLLVKKLSKKPAK